MNEIKCPHCGTVFKIDEANYANILAQVRSKEFDKEIHEKLGEIEQRNQSELALKMAEKDKELTAYKAHIEQLTQVKDNEILEVEKALKNDIIAKEQKIIELETIAKNFEKEKQLEIEKALNEKDKVLESNDYENKKVILELQSKIEKLEADNKLTLAQSLSEKEKEVMELKSKIDLEESKKQMELKALEDNFKLQLKQKEEEIAFYKDFKAKQSTKMIGESLEQHCEIEFNRVRANSFPNAIFGKDNDAKSGSKGDYIYREFDEQGNEIISIMFEMKNEADTTATKKKNTDFLKELDKDRQEKKCEYAILVSMLEADNELYNDGILDVSYAYPKMYVIRPQFFIPIISLLRNAALNSLKYKQEVALMKAQNIDITNFEDELNNFKNAFAKNYNLASRKFSLAIDEIDKTITHLQKTKDALLSSQDNLRLANNKAEDLTVKKLVKKNETMKKKFEELNNTKKDEE